MKKTEMKVKQKILLVDDEPRFIDSLQSILEHFQYECHKAYDGTEAIELLANESFDIALLDVNLPDISGSDIAKLISTKYPDITVIMLTGVNTVETAVVSMKHGAYDFLSKPLDHELLLKTLKKARRHNRLKRQLQTSEQRFQVLSEAAWEGIAIHTDGKILESNRQLTELVGYTEEDFASGMTLDQIISPSSAQDAKDLILTGNDGSCTAYALRKDGTEIPIEVKSRTINYLNKKRRVCVIRDISERVRAEEEKLTLQNKLAVASKLNALGLMAGSIAHDLNNILTGIVSYPDLLLLQMNESDKYYTQIQKMQEAGKRAAAVVSDLVAITRGTEQPKIATNLNEIIIRYLNSLEHGERLANYPKISIQTKLIKNAQNICCSPPHMHKLLLNLIGNSMEALENGGTISISTENSSFVHPLQSVGHSADDQPAAANHIKLVIADDGPGIKKADAERIFEPFYSTKIMGKSGSGLGLSIVWNIVQEHNGWIEVKDNNPGAMFEIYIPTTEEEVCPVSQRYSRILERGEGEEILIIDDQEEQNEILETSLAKLGYQTYSVTSGEKGIEFLESHPVDLILLDMIMGDGLNGRETLERIRQSNPRQKAIVISGYAKRDEINKTRELGISGFIEKPITLSRLSSSIKSSLRNNYQT